MPLPDPESAPLKAFQAMTGDGPPAEGEIEKIILDLDRSSNLEHALAWLRDRAQEPRWAPFRARLKAAVAISRARRMSRWQSAPERRTLRVLFQVAGAAAGLHPPALAAQLARAILDAGLPLAMGLEKTPRPAVHLAHPLPLGCPGRAELADVGFTRAAGVPETALPALINAAAPAGLQVLRCEPVPNHASPAADLCRSALWRWACPEERLGVARERVAAFLAADRFTLAKPGKTGGRKEIKEVEIRPLVRAMEWAGACLEFRTAIVSGQAPNPQKLLAAILGAEPAEITGLERLGLELAEDPRLLQADRYQPKLHNMYEDAVLLEAGSHIRIVEGDDDEPLLLGGGKR